MNIPWTIIETYLKGGTPLNLRQTYLILFQTSPGSDVPADAAVALAVAGLLEQSGMTSSSVILGIRHLLSIFDQVITEPSELQVINVMDGRYLTWRNCTGPLDLETGELVDGYLPTMSVSIVLNRVYQALTQA